jgi:hypothetical protein
MDMPLHLNRLTFRKVAPRVLLMLLLTIAFTGGTMLAANHLASGQTTLLPYTSSSLGLTIDHPDGWTIEERLEDNGGDLVFSQPVPAGGDLSHIGRLQVAKDALPIENTGKEQSAYFGGVRQTWQALAAQPTVSTNDERFTDVQESVLTIGGNLALRVDYDIENFNFNRGEKGRGVRVYLYAGPRRQFVIEMDVHADNQKYLERFDDILRSLRI